MTTVRTTDQAISVIIGMATLPPQIDYISPGKKQELRNAELFIENLPYSENKAAQKKIEEQIDSYYGDTFIGSDGKSYSPASLDAMF